MKIRFLIFVTYLSFIIFLQSNCAPLNPSFSMDVQPIFTIKCALSGCHASATSSNGNLDLTAGSSYGAIVNVASSQLPSYKRVQADNVGRSYLYLKITGNPVIKGAKMPKSGFLSQLEIDTIYYWIEEGAQNN